MIKIAKGDGKKKSLSLSLIFEVAQLDFVFLYDLLIFVITKKFIFEEEFLFKIYTCGLLSTSLLFS